MIFLIDKWRVNKRLCKVEELEESLVFWFGITKVRKRIKKLNDFIRVLLIV